MSSICLCVADIKGKSEMLLHQQRLISIAKAHGRGVVFSVDWSEPIAEYLKDSYVVISLLDSPNSNNCEMLLLPDGWYHNGYTNDVLFEERMSFLQDIAGSLVESNCCIEFYIGASGAKPDEFLDTTVRYQDLTEHLASTIGQEGPEEGRHIIVTK